MVPILIDPQDLLPSLKPVNRKAVHPSFVRPYSSPQVIFLVPVALLRSGRRTSITAVKSYAGGRLKGAQEAGCLGFLQRLRTDGSQRTTEEVRRHASRSLEVLLQMAGFKAHLQDDGIRIWLNPHSRRRGRFSPWTARLHHHP